MGFLGLMAALRAIIAGWLVEGKLRGLSLSQVTCGEAGMLAAILAIICGLICCRFWEGGGEGKTGWVHRLRFCTGNFWGKGGSQLYKKL